MERIELKVSGVIKGFRDPHGVGETLIQAGARILLEAEMKGNEGDGVRIHLSASETKPHLVDDTAKEPSYQLRRQAKIDWILTHWKELGLDGFPWDRNDKEQRSKWLDTRRKIFDSLVGANLLSKKTYWKDVAVENLVTEARTQRRQRQCTA